MACFLRVSGKDLDIDSLLSKISMKAERIWYKGTPRFKNEPDEDKLHLSGASFLTSNEDMDNFDNQVNETTQFIQNNLNDIHTLVNYDNVEDVAIDFAIELRDVAIHSDYLTPQLVKIAGKAGIGIELSHYPTIIS